MDSGDKPFRANDEAGLLMPDIIYHWEDLHHSSFIAFTAEFARINGTLPLPPQTAIKGELTAQVNHGRWLVQCPICPSAAYAPREVPLFYCVECGSKENAGYWYRVIYPDQKRRIEALLLKRPAVLPRSAANRNWTPGETIADVERDNIAHGVGI